MSMYWDTMDGPIVTAAELALEMENVNYILPFVKKKFETELKEAFDNTVIVRELSGEAAEVADYWFFETAVRLYMLGVGKPYKGIKQSRHKNDRVIHEAYKAIENQDKTAFETFLMDSLRETLETKYEITVSKKDYDVNDTDSAREYMNSMQDFVEFSIEIFRIIESR
ncbi:MAG: hypothetical protein F8N39_10635 [Clostridiaceae bacterium]|nr:hypothetical protein [Clostridiaceae bacterium]